ncbi:MAG: S8 family serine peptidase [Cytophagales bacterium]|nr:S8 family serine peptidase [Bernardetiaceae bacterium]MDW8209841.1 S8 family serine peptidase [Cytophagales bacterium]
MLYTIGFLAVLGSALGWLFLKTYQLPFANWIGRSFWISLLIYLLGLYFEEAALLVKLFLMLPLDVAVFISLLLLFNRYVTKSKIWFTVVAAILLAVKFFFFDLASDWFKQNLSTTKDGNTWSSVSLADDGELLIDLNTQFSQQELFAFCKKLDVSCRLAFPNIARPENTSLDEFYVIDIPQKRSKDWEKIAKEFQSAGLIDAFEANELMQLDLPAAAPTRKTQPDFGLNDPYVPQLWGFEVMQVQELFDLLRNIQPRKVATIAIVDTGVESKHEDLQANFHSINADYDTDPVGHGTHCAGIAAAVSNNGKGIASFSLNNRFVRVTSVRVLNRFGGGTQKDVINGIIEAVDKGADVISLSLGGPSLDSYQQAYEEVVKYASQKGAIVVAAAGNADEDAATFAPANVKGVIAVAAVDENLRKASFSNRVGSLDMPIAAPGVNICSTFPNNEYRFLSGTSMATPYVAALLGIMKAIRPTLTAAQAYQLLQQTAADVPDAQQTGRLIQPGKAVAALLAWQ